MTIFQEMRRTTRSFGRDMIDILSTPTLDLRVVRGALRGRLDVEVVVAGRAPFTEEWLATFLAAGARCHRRIGAAPAALFAQSLRAAPTADLVVIERLPLTFADLDALVVPAAVRVDGELEERPPFVDDAACARALARGGRIMPVRDAPLWAVHAVLRRDAVLRAGAWLHVVGGEAVPLV